MHLRCLRWLPTNYRRSKGTARANFCFLCTGNVPETPRHLLYCPALKTARVKLQSSLEAALSKVFRQQLFDPFEDFVRSLSGQVQTFLRSHNYRISEERLLLLIKLFVETNKDRLGLSRLKCQKQILRILTQRKCECTPYRSHTCYLRNCWRTPTSFLQIVQESFKVNC